MPLAIRGRTGRLRSGGRTLAQLDGWTAEPVGPSALRVRAAACERDVFWWEQRGNIPLLLELGWGRIGLRGPAVIESDDPLVVVVEYETVPPLG